MPKSIVESNVFREIISTSNDAIRNASDHRVGMFDQHGKLNPSFAWRKIDIQDVAEKISDEDASPSLFDENTSCD